MRVTPNHRNLTEIPFGQIMPSWTVAMDGVQLQYLVLTSEYRAQFFPSCLKCFAFILKNFYFRMRECFPVFVGREKAQFGTNSTGPIWHQFYWTNSTRLRLLFEFLNPSLRSLHLFDGSVQLPFGVDPPLANSPDNSEQTDDGQQVNCNHFLRLLSNLVCSLRTSTQSSCRIHSGRDNRASWPRAICMVVFFNLRA